MITVSVKQLVSAIAGADTFKLLDMNKGVDYLYNNLYMRLSQGEEVKLPEINFSGFEIDDVDAMRDVYFNVLEANENKVDTLVSTLRSIPPVVTSAAFV